ncbi:MAG: DUF2085 domain-containing protein [Chloroflexota bacterium]
MNNVDASPRIPRWLAGAVAVFAVIVLFVWMESTPPGIDGKIDAVGYAICHRIPARSFLINGMPMPLCARCTGIYLGVMTSFLIAVASGRTKVSRLPPIRVLVALGLFVVVMGLDGINSYIHLFPGGTGVYEPHNWLRLVTGMYCGVALFNFIFPIFNNIVWRNADPGRNLNSARELLGVCAVCACVIVLVLTERPVFLWVFGVLSTIGVAMMLTMIGTVLFLTVFRLDKFATRWQHLAIPLLAGLTIALIEVGAIDMLRLALTGTWNGFPLGG